MFWTKEEVQQWILACAAHYGLAEVQVENFALNGNPVRKHSDTPKDAYDPWILLQGELYVCWRDPIFLLDVHLLEMFCTIPCFPTWRPVRERSEKKLAVSYGAARY